MRGYHREPAMRVVTQQACATGILEYWLRYGQCTDTNIWAPGNDTWASQKRGGKKAFSRKPFHHATTLSHLLITESVLSSSTTIFLSRHSETSLDINHVTLVGQCQ